jgi:hypothetical protein
MRKLMAKSLATTVIGVLAAGSPAFVGTSVAGAASDYSHAQFQVTWSLNCTNRSAACATDPNSALVDFGAGPRSFRAVHLARLQIADRKPVVATASYPVLVPVVLAMRPSTRRGTSSTHPFLRVQ